MTDWQMLVTSALLGIERRPLQLSPDAPLPGPTGDDAQTLLRAAAVLAVQRRAGYAPPHDDASLPPAPEETQPCCSRRAAHYLAELLSDPYRHYPMLVEWLERVAVKRQRLPYALLPVIFDHATRWKQLGPLAALVGGERGRWLAAQNPGWRHIAGADLNDAWHAIRTKPAPVHRDEALKAVQVEAGRTPEQALQQLLAGRRVEAAEVVDLLLDHLLPNPGSKIAYVSGYSLSLLAMSVSPDGLNRVTARVRQTHATGIGGLEPVLRLLELRAEMLRELDRD